MKHISTHYDSVPVCTMSSVKPHSFRSVATMSFHRDFCPPAAHRPFNKEHTNRCFGSRSSLLWAKCPTKWSHQRVIVEETRSCPDILRIAILRSMSFMDTLRMILRHHITKLCKWLLCGSRRTAHSKSYNNVGKITDLRMRVLEAFWFCIGTIIPGRESGKQEMPG